MNFSLFHGDRHPVMSSDSDFECVLKKNDTITGKVKSICEFTDSSDAEFNVTKHYLDISDSSSSVRSLTPLPESSHAGMYICTFDIIRRFFFFP